MGVRVVLANCGDGDITAFCYYPVMLMDATVIMVHLFVVILSSGSICFMSRTNEIPYTSCALGDSIVARRSSVEVGCCWHFAYPSSTAFLYSDE